MPKVTEAYLEERRQQILEAAIVCFARKGFHQTTMEDIGREAGLSPTVAYRYFDGKEDIIVATVQQSVTRAARAYDASADEEDTFLVLERMIDDYYRRLEQPDRVTYYRVRLQLWAEAFQDGRVAEETRLRHREAQKQHVALIEKGQERGQIDPNLDARSMAIAYMASFDGFILHWLAEPDIDLKKYRDAHMAMVRGWFIDRQ